MVIGNIRENKKKQNSVQTIPILSEHSKANDFNRIIVIKLFTISTFHFHFYYYFRFYRLSNHYISYH